MLNFKRHKSSCSGGAIVIKDCNINEKEIYSWEDLSDRLKISAKERILLVQKYPAQFFVFSRIINLFFS